MAETVTRIYIHQTGRNKVSLRNLPDNVDSLFKQTQIQLNQLAYRLVDKMMDFSRKRPRNYPGVSNLGKALRDTIKIDNIGKHKYRISIGDVNYLNQVAPYWKILNYGGNPWQGKAFFGFFDGGKPPIRREAGEPWTDVGGYVRGQGFGTPFMMRPKHPIEGKRYITKGINWLNREWAYLTRNVPIWYMREMRGIFLTGKTSEMTRERLGIKTR